MIDTLSWGDYDTSKYTGYIAINGQRVFGNRMNEVYSGFIFVEVNVSSCSASNVLTFSQDSSTFAVKSMVTYINNLPWNTVLIGITSNEPAQYLTPNATSALLAIGVNVTGLKTWGKVSFVTQIGQPANTVFQVDPPNGNNLQLDITISGTSSRPRNFICISVY
jgi:Interleukin-like EMT inducer